MKQYRRVFAALDGGSTQQEVAERAIQIAKLNLSLIHISEPTRP